MTIERLHIFLDDSPGYVIHTRYRDREKTKKHEYIVSMIFYNFTKNRKKDGIVFSCIEPTIQIIFL